METVCVATFPLVSVAASLHTGGLFVPVVASSSGPVADGELHVVDLASVNIESGPAGAEGGVSGGVSA